mmetsp:Transcript_12996/g.18763  ORF Transcript_12996/g.18763 Transcript_12996/m.18763 type:complete len:224 (+) Transcript_12996:585-1256(+)
MMECLSFQNSLHIGRVCVRRARYNRGCFSKTLGNNNPTNSFAKRCLEELSQGFELLPVRLIASLHKVCIFILEFHILFRNRNEFHISVGGGSFNHIFVHRVSKVNDFHILAPEPLHELAVFQLFHILASKYINLLLPLLLPLNVFVKADEIVITWELTRLKSQKLHKLGLVSFILHDSHLETWSELFVECVVGMFFFLFHRFLFLVLFRLIFVFVLRWRPFFL